MTGLTDSITEARTGVTDVKLFIDGKFFIVFLEAQDLNFFFLAFFNFGMWIYKKS
jgi:hypothetical protein